MSRRQDIDYSTQHPIHDAVFGGNPHADYTDTPRGAISENVNLNGTGVMPDGFEPMHGVGDTDQRNRQPDGRLRQ